MDYEKLYKEALKRAKEYHDVDTDNELNVYAKGTMEYIFPELAESDDEKIRKYIINFVEVNKEVNLSTTDADRMLAWLEKQGEQKPIEGTFINIDDVREHFINEVYRVLDADPTNDRANQIITAFDTLPTTNIQQNIVEWSKEDENKRLSVIEKLEDFYEYNHDRYSCEFTSINSKNNILRDIQDNIDWLKSLRPQKKQEFKIEKGNWYRCVQAAKKATDDLAYALQNGIDYYAPDDNAILDRYGYRWDLTKRTQSWINEHFAPIPQKQWKPTKEQISYLEDAIDMYEPNEANSIGNVVFNN